MYQEITFTLLNGNLHNGNHNRGQNERGVGKIQSTKTLPLELSCGVNAPYLHPLSIHALNVLHFSVVQSG